MRMLFLVLVLISGQAFAQAIDSSGTGEGTIDSSGSNPSGAVNPNPPQKPLNDEQIEVKQRLQTFGRTKANQIFNEAFPPPAIQPTRRVPKTTVDSFSSSTLFGIFGLAVISIFFWLFGVGAFFLEKEISFKRRLAAAGLTTGVVVLGGAFMMYSAS